MRGQVVHALVGSANFSENGLTTPYKEVLAETTKDTFKPLNDYLKKILEKAIPCSSASTKAFRQSSINQESANIDPNVCSMSLLIKENGKLVTMDDFKRYGRTSIDVSLQGEGVYYFDFSTKETKEYQFQERNTIWPKIAAEKPKSE